MNRKYYLDEIWVDMEGYEERYQISNYGRIRSLNYRNEGKVLVMDNPFAQTNASHLLKPLMDMAKKTNTQLICLSGLGGESIYNRFDNIYVLNLIAASLRNGMQYLKADHVRGNEPETMVVSQIEVMEQQELIF